MNLPHPALHSYSGSLGLLASPRPISNKLYSFDKLRNSLYPRTHIASSNGMGSTSMWSSADFSDQDVTGADSNGNFQHIASINMNGNGPDLSSKKLRDYTEVAYLTGRSRIVAQHFPTSLAIDDFLHRLEIALYAYGFNGDNSIGMHE